MKICNNSKRRALIRAIEYEYHEASKLILREDIDFSGINGELFVCLFNFFIGQYLFDAPAVYKLLNCNIDTDVRERILKLAIVCQCAGVIEESIRTGTDLSKPMCGSLYPSMHPREKYNDEQCTPSIPLHYFARKGRKGDSEGDSYERVMRVLLKHHSDPNIRDADDRNVLHYAVAGPAPFDLIQEILERGVSVDAVSKRGHNLIHVAYVRPDVDRVIPLLIEHVDEATKKAWAITALELLVCDDELDTIVATKAVVEMEYFAYVAGKLRNIKADIYRQIVSQIVAIDVMINTNCRMRFKILRTFFDRRWATGFLNVSFLRYLTEILNGNVSAIKIILGSFGTQIDQSIQQALLHSALVRDRPEVVEVLLEHGIKIETVLNASIQSIVESLLRKRASVVDSFSGKITSIDYINRDTYLLKRLMANTKFAEIHNVRMIIKIFAVLIANSIAVDETDVDEMIQNLSVTQTYYNRCLEELQKMKTFAIVDDLSAFCFFDRNLLRISKLCRNSDFVVNYESCLKKIVTKFPIYFVEIEATYRIAEKAKNIEIDIENVLLEISNDLLPQTAIRKIVDYACSEHLLKLQFDSFLCCSFVKSANNE